MENKTFIAIDFETADNKPDSACAIGMVRIENMLIVDSFVSLIRPPREKFMFTYIHGICWEDVANEESFAEVWAKAKDFVKGVDGFIAHNASFDRNVLTHCCKNGQQVFPQVPFFCTLKASRKYLNLKNNKLSDVANHFNIELNHHEALSDAKASGEIFINLHSLGNDLNLCTI